MVTRAESAEEKWWSASYHEAGHAAVLVMYRHPILESRIEVHTPWFGVPSASGLVEVPHHIEDMDDEGLAESIVVYMSGAEAQAWWHHQNDGWSLNAARDYSYDIGAGSDLAGAQKCIDAIGANARYVRYLEGMAQEAVAACWDSIEEIAEALRDNNGFLTGDQIYNIA